MAPSKRLFNPSFYLWVRKSFSLPSALVAWEHSLLRLLRWNCISTTNNGRIRDLVGSPAVLAPQEDRLASSPYQIASGFILLLSPALAPLGYGYSMLQQRFPFGCSYRRRPLQANTWTIFFYIVYGCPFDGLSRVMRLTSFAESERFELPKPFSFPL